MSKALLNLNLTPYKMPSNCPNAPHLFYADDRLISTDDSKTNLEKLMVYLDDYSKVSGQLINLSKSSFYVHHKISVSMKQIISNTTEIGGGTMSYLYLGAHINYKKLFAHHFDLILSKIEKKVSDWKG